MEMNIGKVFVIRLVNDIVERITHHKFSERIDLEFSFFPGEVGQLNPPVFCVRFCRNEICQLASDAFSLSSDFCITLPVPAFIGFIFKINCRSPAQRPVFTGSGILDNNISSGAVPGEAVITHTCQSVIAGCVEI